jgi:DNA-binding Lrp family transcriptional regulator
MRMDQVERRLLNDYQRDFPLEPHPYARIANELGLGEDEVLAMLADLQGNGTLSRIGAVVRPNTVGASTLAAMAVPAGRLEAVAALVSARPEVNHNYEREHALNLWFVVAAADEAAVQAVLEAIETETGLPVIDLPLQTAYHIDLGFDLSCA